MKKPRLSVCPSVDARSLTVRTRTILRQCLQLDLVHQQYLGEKETLNMSMFFSSMSVLPGGPGGPWKPGLDRENGTAMQKVRATMTYAPGKPTSPIGPGAPEPPGLPEETGGKSMFDSNSTKRHTWRSREANLTWIAFHSRSTGLANYTTIAYRVERDRQERSLPCFLSYLQDLDCHVRLSRLVRGLPRSEIRFVDCRNNRSWLSYLNSYGFAFRTRQAGKAWSAGQTYRVD